VVRGGDGEGMAVMGMREGVGRRERVFVLLGPNEPPSSRSRTGRPAPSTTPSRDHNRMRVRSRRRTHARHAVRSPRPRSMRSHASVIRRSERRGVVVVVVARKRRPVCAIAPCTRPAP
jgi:hypothetical protein